jgi:uncharacterized membrane protein YcgQ (UPF0703/DUF1980 family)
MRKKFWGVTAAAMVAWGACWAWAEGPDTAGIVDIKEKMFLTQTNDVYVNKDEYLGRTIRLEGMFGTLDNVTPPCRYVYRFGPGCCGYDSNAGFEVVWKKPDATYPNDNDWVAATGVLEDYEQDGESFLRLALNSLVVKSVRGKEEVEQ